MPLLLGLTGKAHAGKDTLAKVLQQQREFTRLAFADPLKDVCAALFGVPRTHFDDPDLKEVRVKGWGLSPRQMLQLVGTDMVRRELGEDFWIKRMRYELNGRLGYENIVITDVRFDNEANFVRELGGTVVHLVRPGAGLAGETGAHRSEMGVAYDAHDIIFLNDGALADLAEKSASLLEFLSSGVNQ